VLERERLATERTGDFQAHPALSRQHPLIPTSGQNRARYGAPSFAAQKKNERPGFRPRPWLEMNSLVAEEEDARGLVFSHVTHRPVEELVVFEIDLKEGWALGDSAGDQGFREWVFHVPL
jgi:hypothetical protein